MRNDFVRQMHKEMAEDKSIVFLTGDLGFNALESLAKDFPDRFYNVGIAEQNMAGIAAGLALEGHKVIIYSIASFVTMRCFEQIRTDICYHNLDVKIIGTGGGFNYSDNGITHHTIEDLSLMLGMPNMQVYCPSHSWEAIESTKAMIKRKGPAYLRLGKSPGIAYENSNWKFKASQGYIIKPGSDISLFLTGNITDIAFSVENILKKAGISTTIISMPTIKPIDENLIIRQSKTSKGIFTLEEHSFIGGLGDIVARILAHIDFNLPFKSFGIPDKFIKDVGSREFLLHKAELSPDKISRSIIKKLRK